MVRDAKGQVENPDEVQPWWKDHKWIALAVTLLLGLLSSPVIVSLFNRESSTASELRACMELHGLQKTPQETREDFDEGHADKTGEFNRRVFATCNWPPPDYAAGDGYSEVVVTMTRGPGDYEASSATLLDRVEATCSSVRFTYQVGAQGYFTPLAPFTASRGTVAYAGDGEAHPWDDVWEPSRAPYPKANEIVLLHDGKISLSSAECVESID